MSFPFSGCGSWRCSFQLLLLLLLQLVLLSATSSAKTSSSASSAGVVGAFTPSRTSFVNGQRESQVFVSFAPSTSSIVRHPSRFNNPESTRSSKFLLDLRGLGLKLQRYQLLLYSTVLQDHEHVLLLFQAVIDILFPPCFVSYISFAEYCS